MIATAVVRLGRVPALDRLDPADVAEAFRDLPSLALLESRRTGRTGRWTFLCADPVAVLAQDTLVEVDPARPNGLLAEARRFVRRLTIAPIEANADSDSLGRSDAPPFLGGLIGYIAYEFGHALERLPAPPPDDQGLPVLRLGLYDWVIAWDHRRGQAWLGGRAVDGDATALDRRLAAVRDRLAGLPRGQAVSSDERSPVDFVSTPDRAGFESGVERIREAIAAGDIYQANLTRRLAADFRCDPWPTYRALRAGDPALFGAYLALDAGSEEAGPQAILSASPEPFLSVDRFGRVRTDPIKGSRPRGATRAEDRVLAGELLASAKDRAENVMIVDVLRNDLGRVCRPGTVRVPRICRLERAGAVQHLVSTVTGTLAPGLDAFDLLRASFPGGSITGATKIRAMEILLGLEGVRRGPYTGAAVWIGPDGAMGSSILIRTFVADGRRLMLNVGGGITWRSDPAAEWDETVAKAAGPLRAIGGRPRALATLIE